MILPLGRSDRARPKAGSDPNLNRLLAQLAELLEQDCVAIRRVLYLAIAR
jgi:hypothetical protein